MQVVVSAAATMSLLEIGWVIVADLVHGEDVLTECHQQLLAVELPSLFHRGTREHRHALPPCVMHRHAWCAASAVRR
jgi:hypothetical protein